MFRSADILLNIMSDRCATCNLYADVLYITLTNKVIMQQNIIFKIKENIVKK